MKLAKQPVHSPTSTSRADTRRMWLTFAVVAIGSFLGPFSGSIVIVALPSIAPAYGIDLQSVKWIIITYLVVTNALLPITGKLGQRLGATNVYLAGFLIFGLGSIACALAPATSIFWLIAGRAVQALGAALVFGISPALITSCVPAHRRSLAFGILGSIVALGLITAQPLGVVLCDQLSWRWIFLIQAPVAFLAVLLGWWLLPKNSSRNPARLPWPGLAAWSVIITGLALIGEALSKGLWIHYLPLTTALTATAIIAFVFTERKTIQLFNYTLFRYGAFRQGTVAVLVSYSIMYVMILLLPFYFIDYLSLTTFQKALLFCISPLSAAFAGPAAGHLADRIGFRVPIITGLILMTVGYAGLAGGVQSHSLWLIGLSLALQGLGSGLFSGPNYSAMMGCVTDLERNSASSFVSLVRNISFLLGTSLSAILFNLLIWHNGGYKMMLAARTEELAQVVPPAVFYSSFGVALLISSGIALVGVIASLRFPNRLQSQH